MNGISKFGGGGAACRRVRDLLCAQGPVPPGARRAAALPRAVADHLADCAACTAFARRLQLARQALREPLPEVEPDAEFPARVLARIARPAELLGWAAFRALPAALGLALVLAWLGLAGPVAAPVSPPSPLLDGPPSSDQLLAWASLSPEVWP
jgi:hypothetical protein